MSAQEILRLSSMHVICCEARLNISWLFRSLKFIRNFKWENYETIDYHGAVLISPENKSYAGVKSPNPVEEEEKRIS